MKRILFSTVFLGLFVLPLFSQHEIEPNNNCQEADPREFPASITGRINPEGDEDYFEFTVLTPGIIEGRVFTNAGSSELSFDIEILDDLCLKIDENGFSDDVSVKERICEPGTYYIKVSDHFNRSSDSLYYLQVDFDVRDTFECNDNFFSAADLDFGSQIMATIKDEEDCDYFKLDVLIPGVIEGRVFTTAGSSELSFDLTLYDSSFEEIKKEGFSDDISIKMRICEPGPYYIKVNDHFNRCSDALYILQVEFDDRDTFECNDDIFSAAELDLGTDITATLRDEEDCDYFEITLLVPGTIEARVFTTAGSSELSFDLRLFNSSFAEVPLGLGWSDDISFELELLEPGTYYIKINDHFNRCSDAIYTLQTSFTPMTNVVEIDSRLLSLTPNPSADIITLEIQENLAIERELRLSIYDNTGCFIKRLELTPNLISYTISVQDLSPGLYYFHLSAGSKYLTKKFLKL